MSLAWTEDQVSFLQQCIAGKLSARESVERFYIRFGEVVTRNTLMGKAARAGWRFDSANSGEPRPRRKRAPGQHLQAAERITQKRSRVSLPPEALPQTPMSDLAIPAEQRKRLLELENHHCRFPVGDVGTAEFFFCGAPEADVLAGVPYCPAHTWRATNHAGMAKCRRAA